MILSAKPRLRDRVCVVTGAGRGIGAAIARRFADEGARVTIADRDLASAETLAARLRAEGATATAWEAEVTDRASVRSMIDAAADERGVIDVLVNNVGASREVAFEAMTDDDWDFQIDATLTSAFLCSQAAIDRLAASIHGGRIINIGSVNGLHPFGHEAYSAGKAGLVSLTENLAQSLGGRGIRVNLVAPGTVRTPAWTDRLAIDPSLGNRMASFTALGEIGEPWDIAAACAFLASDDARWITGIVLPVDGGLGGGGIAMARARILDGQSG